MIQILKLQMAHFEHGALDKTTGRLVDPHTAAKRTLYECPDCKRNVFARKGEVRVAHFSHCKDVENACSYFNRNPSRDQQHKNAQMKLKQFIERGVPINVKRPCVCGRCGISAVFLLAPGKELDVSPCGVRYPSSATVKLEHRFQFEGSTKIADVAVLDDKAIACVIEVVHAHYTREMDRPEPWYEFMAKEINSISSDATEITLTCVRQKRTLTCIANESAREQEVMGYRRRQILKQIEWLKKKETIADVLAEVRAEEARVRRKKQEEADKIWRKQQEEARIKWEKQQADEQRLAKLRFLAEEEERQKQLETEAKLRKPIVSEIERQRKRSIIFDRELARIEETAPLCPACVAMKRKKPSSTCCVAPIWMKFKDTELLRIYQENGVE